MEKKEQFIIKESNSGGGACKGAQWDIHNEGGKGAGKKKPICKKPSRKTELLRHLKARE